MSDKISKREYLQRNGYPVGKRGKFSGAQLVALREAEAQGIQFKDKTIKTSKS